MSETPCGDEIQTNLQMARAWTTAEQVLASFADAMSKWLGASIVILAVTPLGASNGEIIMKS